jgi:hypothetical protein
VHVRFEHRIPLSAERFWEMIHAPDYEAEVAEAVGLAAYAEEARRETPAHVFRRIHVVPPLPDWMRALFVRLGGGDGPAWYKEEQWRSKRRMEVRWRMIPPILVGRSRVEGVVRVEAIDAGSCRRILEGDIEVRLPGLGGRLERTLAESTRAAYDRAAEVAARRARAA